MTSRFYLTITMAITALLFSCSGEEVVDKRSKLSSVSNDSDMKALEPESATLKLSDSSTSVDIAFVHSGNSDGKEGDKLEKAISSLESSVSDFIKFNLFLLANKKCATPEGSDCISLTDAGEAKFKKTIYNAELGTDVDGIGAVVLNHLNASELSKAMNEENKHVIVSISDKFNLGDSPATELQEQLTSSFSAPSFFAFDSSAFDSDYCTISGVGNFEELAGIMGGKLYRYCQEKWDEDFIDIAKSLLEDLKIEIPVSLEEGVRFELITSVKIRDIDIEDYTFVKDLQILRIPYAKISELALMSSDEVVIEYTLSEGEE